MRAPASLFNGTMLISTLTRNLFLKSTGVYDQPISAVRFYRLPSICIYALVWTNGAPLFNGIMLISTLTANLSLKSTGIYDRCIFAVRLYRLPTICIYAAALSCLALNCPLDDCNTPTSDHITQTLRFLYSEPQIVPSSLARQRLDKFLELVYPCRVV